MLSRDYFKDASKDTSCMPERVLQLMRYGLLPFWRSVGPGHEEFAEDRMSYARSETLLTTRSFRPLLVKGQRCVIVANG